jgi:LAO/AO transport system kinase
MMDLVEKLLCGAPRSLSRLITLVERDDPDVPQIMREVYPHLGRAHSIGMTGPPGGGKSTIVDKLAIVARGKGLSVGIIAVDPTSPFSGGAILGDRVRMQHHFLDSGVFIRSIATRGCRGGLPQAARGAIKLLDASGKDLIIVETVGVGQTELDIVESVDTIIVVLCPEAGDTIQTMKAGLMEIADIFVVNKADREGANKLVTELESVLHLSPVESEWQTPVLTTQASHNIGIAELYQEVERHREFLKTSRQLWQRRCKQRKEELLRLIEQRIRGQLLSLIEKDELLTASLRKVEGGELDPYSAAGEVLSNKTLIKAWLSELEEDEHHNQGH